MYNVIIFIIKQLSLSKILVLGINLYVWKTQKKRKNSLEFYFAPLPLIIF